MSSKSKKRRSERVSMTKAVVAAEVMFIWAWMEALHPSPDDVREAIKDEHGWEIV